MIDKIVTLKNAVIGYADWQKPIPGFDKFLADQKTRKYALEIISYERSVTKPRKIPAGASVYVLRENDKSGYIGFTLYSVVGVEQILDDMYIRHITIDDVCKGIWWDVGVSFKVAEAGRLSGDFDRSLAKTIAFEMLADYRSQDENEAISEGLSYRSTNYFNGLMNFDERVKDLSDVEQKVLYLASTQIAFRARRK